MQLFTKRLAGPGARPEAVRRTARSKWRKGRLAKGGMLQKKEKNWLSFETFIFSAACGKIKCLWKKL